ncbi:MAG: hypothetical protein RL685_7243, partial [Pseudomonadota bacterium]
MSEPHLPGTLSPAAPASEELPPDTAVRPTLSVVVPVYGSQDCVAELAAQVARVCGEHALSYELILVYDCSPDRSWEAILGVVAQDPAVIGIRLRKNFGQDNAIMAGMNHARGEAIVVMDDDL